MWPNWWGSYRGSAPRGAVNSRRCRRSHGECRGQYRASITSGACSPSGEVSFTAVLCRRDSHMHRPAVRPCARGLGKGSRGRSFTGTGDIGREFDAESLNESLFFSRLANMHCSCKVCECFRSRSCTQILHMICQRCVDEATTANSVAVGTLAPSISSQPRRRVLQRREIKSSCWPQDTTTSNPSRLVYELTIQRRGHE